MSTPKANRLQIDRTCPACRQFGSQYFSEDVPSAYGCNTTTAVLARCGNGMCQHDWRAILRPAERYSIERAYPLCEFIERGGDNRKDALALRRTAFLVRKVLPTADRTSKENGRV